MSEAWPAGRRRLLAGAGALVVVAALSLTLAAPALADSGLGRRIAAILTRYHLAGGRTAVRVWDMDTGEQVYGRRIHALLAPASNEKLVTSATALARWGPDQRFKTELYLPPGQPDAGGVVHGRVWLKGYGDPTLATAAYQRSGFHARTASLAGFVAALRALGVRRVAGISGDESYFDTRRTVPGWRPGLAAYCGPLSALSLNEGLRGGARVARPALYAADELRRLLKDAGIAVAGDCAVGRLPTGMQLTHTEYSPPLRRVLALMNKPSDNFIAEMLAKGLGREFGGAGSTAAGMRVERAFLAECGVPLSEVRLCDGSGLCYGNRLTAAGITRVLRTMSERLDFGTFWGSLAVAGHDGTLRDRMRGTLAVGNLRAKTGTLDIASSLSGYVASADHESLIFSVLMNGGSVNYWAARRAQDAIGAALAASHF